MTVLTYLAVGLSAGAGGLAGRSGTARDGGGGSTSGGAQVFTRFATRDAH